MLAMMNGNVAFFGPASTRLGWLLSGTRVIPQDSPLRLLQDPRTP
jgi:hypothetical protein